MSYDAFAADHAFFYNYSELRGLSKAVRGRIGNWKSISVSNEDCKGLKGVSLLVYKDMLLMRHQGQPDTIPFVAYSKDTLQPLDTEFKFEEEKAQECKKLNWSEHKVQEEQ